MKGAKQMPRRKWCVSNLDKEKASELSAACSIDPFASLLLVSRGITSKEEVLFLWRCFLQSVFHQRYGQSGRKN